MMVGDHVYKRSGYAFAGIVRSIFPKSDGQVRAVVEMDKPNDAGCHGDSGLLHIFNLDQLVRS